MGGINLQCNNDSFSKTGLILIYDNFSNLYKKSLTLKQTLNLLTKLIKPDYFFDFTKKCLFLKFHKVFKNFIGNLMGILAPKRALLSPSV